ncbi:MAG: LLM class F420-dependent oxidoreductase [Deltaproteobacteria bacterium]|nr:TIGR03619 family F420-dependent LLM class oxidoreductase [Deltaproteobacteria bacterium]MBW2223675.1 TIGR03619 family F420-dependent LLM class oxidoreductase [Deltaproteobacteria bacterium]MBW2402483.1 TIGR03619 family F420-dependent LLM class oxidoreductase [Deltaproteobacteria bacterium]MBW2546322.1 TIGR03619 family F420-dependent LLM class oxidoreductase [Deltaproteobacteria bacterium]MBW2716999.1 TIGR03619 family F420-dependent LLM class oxidoreductase [Deltaproteobacteria bacterium]
MKFSASIAMAPPEQYIPIAREAEKLGYHAIVLPDSIFFSEEVSKPYPYTKDGSRMWDGETPWIEPIVGAAAMAAATETIFFYTSVVKLPVRHPVLVAKQVASLAALSNNRFGFGCGLGWLPEEFKWCGTDFETRGKRMNECLEILRLIWGGGMVEYHGEHYDFGKIQMSPAPTQPIPIYVGGHSKPGLRRAAKYGDGWSSAMLPSKKLLALIAEIEVFRKEYGRDHLPMEYQAVVTDVWDADGYKRLEDAGVTDIITVPWLMYGTPMVGGTLQGRIDGLNRYADTVIAKMQ